jgi:hypothetical protein
MPTLNDLTGEHRDELIKEYRSCLKIEDQLRARKSQIRKKLRMTPRSLKQIVLETIHTGDENA